MLQTVNGSKVDDIRSTTREVMKILVCYSHPGHILLTLSLGPAPDTFLSELSKNVSIVFFSGNDDALIAHRGTERM